MLQRYYSLFFFLFLRKGSVFGKLHVKFSRNLLKMYFSDVNVSDSVFGCVIRRVSVRVLGIK